MRLNTDKVFAYLKATLPESAPVHVQLSGDDELLMKPFVGRLVVRLAYDSGDRFEILQRRHLAELSMDERDLFELGVTNLEALAASGQVRVHQHGAGYALIAGGNFEASLLLVDSVWEWICRHVGTTQLLARAPARDVLMVAPADDPAGRAELDALLHRISDANLDHALSDELLFWDGTAWTIAPDPRRGSGRLRA